MGSISPVIFLGASVVLVDCDRATWNMDPDLLASARMGDVATELRYVVTTDRGMDV